MPQISVIVPVYKVEPYLRRCIDSILSQSFPDFELILVDDGSPDGCPAICDEYALRDSRVRVIHKENGGVSSARNVGIDWMFSNSNSEWLLFVDSDDWVHPKLLELLYAATLECGVRVSVCSFQRTCGENLRLLGEGAVVKCWKPEDYYNYDTVTSTVAWAKLYSKSCFGQIRYPVGKIHEDEYVTYRILFGLDKIAVIEEPLYAYYQNQNGIMKSPWTPKRLDMIQAFEEQLTYFQDNSFREAYSKRMKEYVGYLTNLVKKLENEKEFKEYLSCVRKKLRQHLPQCRRSKVINIAYDTNVYIAAYPALKSVWKFLSFAKYVPNKVMLWIIGEVNYQKVKKWLGR